MILYHPATDFYHCWIRIASLLLERRSQGVECDRIRVIDFYLCFPQELEKCRLPAEYSSKIRKLVRHLPTRYEDRNSLRQAFGQMSRIAQQVMMDMVAKGVVERSAFREGSLVPTSDQTKIAILEAVGQKWAHRREEWFSEAVRCMFSIPLNGENGLKHRSGLLEFRYDE